MKAADVMSHQVVTVRNDTPLSDAVKLMLKFGVSGLPVVDVNGTPVGILTEGDLLRRAETGTERKRSRWLEFLLGPGKMASDYVHTHGRKVQDVMTTSLISVTPGTPLAEIVGTMERRHIKRVPVVANSRIVGIVSRANLMQALLSVADAVPPAQHCDEEIRARLWAELEKSGWAPMGLINVFVRDGVVHLHGTITEGSERDALRVMAENIPGVREVHDHLAWCDYLTGTVVDIPDEEGNPDASGQQQGKH
jgi:CBS domain-containing protein